MHGCLDAWIRGCVDAWARGCVDAWMHGCMCGWMPASIDDIWQLTLTTGGEKQVRASWPPSPETCGRCGTVCGSCVQLSADLDGVLIEASASQTSRSMTQSMIERAVCLYVLHLFMSCMSVLFFIYVCLSMRAPVLSNVCMSTHVHVCMCACVHARRSACVHVFTFVWSIWV
jgi:hypothetical protein